VRILEENKVEYEVIEYLKTPLRKDEIKKILQILGVKAKGIVRVSEGDFIENNLDEILDDDEKMIDAIAQYPKIMERPIIINQSRGVIGRPPEKILEII
tara:strand:+ start:1384 stop:1680 length:297 start_codon:yes stop_codon:yes gene_type:complete